MAEEGGLHPAEKEVLQSPRTEEELREKLKPLVRIKGSLGGFLKPANLEEVYQGFEEGRFVAFEFEPLEDKEEKIAKLKKAIAGLEAYSQELDQAKPLERIYSRYAQILALSRKMRLARIEGDSQAFMEVAEQFYPQPDEALYQEAEYRLRSCQDKLFPPGKKMKADKLKTLIRATYLRFGLEVSNIELVEGQSSAIRVVPRPGKAFKIEIAVDENGNSKVEEVLADYSLTKQAISAIRKANGKKQPLKHLQKGRPMPGYLTDETGLQLYIARELIQQGWEDKEQIPEKLLIPEITLVARKLAKEKDAYQVCQTLQEEYGISEETAREMAIKVKRGTSGQAGEFYPRSGIAMVGLVDVGQWVNQAIDKGHFRGIKVENEIQAVNLLLCCKCSVADLQEEGVLGQIDGFKLKDDDLVNLSNLFV